MHVLFFLRKSETKRLFEYQSFDRIIIGDGLSRNWKEFCGMYNLTRFREVAGSCDESNELRIQ